MFIIEVFFGKLTGVESFRVIRRSGRQWAKIYHNKEKLVLCHWIHSQGSSPVNWKDGFGWFIIFYNFLLSVDYPREQV